MPSKSKSESAPLIRDQSSQSNAVSVGRNVSVAPGPADSEQKTHNFKSKLYILLWKSFVLTIRRRSHLKIACPVILSVLAFIIMDYYGRKNIYDSFLRAFSSSDNIPQEVIEQVYHVSGKMIVALFNMLIFIILPPVTAMLGTSSCADWAAERSEKLSATLELYGISKRLNFIAGIIYYGGIWAPILSLIIVLPIQLFTYNFQGSNIILVFLIFVLHYISTSGLGMLFANLFVKNGSPKTETATGMMHLISVLGGLGIAVITSNILMTSSGLWTRKLFDAEKAIKLMGGGQIGGGNDSSSDKSHCQVDSNTVIPDSIPCDSFGKVMVIFMIGCIVPNFSWTLMIMFVVAGAYGSMADIDPKNMKQDLSQIVEYPFQVTFKNLFDFSESGGYGSMFFILLSMIVNNLILLGLNFIIDIGWSNIFSGSKSKKMGVALDNGTTDSDNAITDNSSDSIAITIDNGVNNNSGPTCRGSVPALQLQNLTKRFVNKVANNNLNFHVNTGEIFGLLGHNGAGKSTLVNMLTGVMSPSKGDAYVCGKSVRREMNSVRKLMAVCPQDNPVWNELKVREHLYFYAICRGDAVVGYGSSRNNNSGESAESLNKNKVMINKTIERCCTALGLMEKIDSKCGELSGGQKRRLWVATALLGQSTKLLLMDEPTSGMDPESRRDFWVLLKNLVREEKKSVVFSTHYLEEADLLADRKVVLASGRVKAIGTSGELKKQFGTGYWLNVVFNNDVTSDLLQHAKDDLVRVATKVLVDNTGTLKLDTKCRHTNPRFFSISIPWDCVDRLPKLLEIIADITAKEKRIEQYAIELTSLDEVFTRIGEQEENEHGNDKNCKVPSGSGSESNSTNKNLHIVDTLRKRNNSFFNQVFAVFCANFHNFIALPIFSHFKMLLYIGLFIALQHIFSTQAAGSYPKRGNNMVSSYVNGRYVSYAKRKESDSDSNSLGSARPSYFGSYKDFVYRQLENNQIVCDSTRDAILQVIGKLEKSKLIKEKIEKKDTKNIEIGRFTKSPETDIDKLAYKSSSGDFIDAYKYHMSHVRLYIDSRETKNLVESNVSSADQCYDMLKKRQMKDSHNMLENHLYILNNYFYNHSDSSPDKPAALYVAEKKSCLFFASTEGLRAYKEDFGWIKTSSTSTSSVTVSVSDSSSDSSNGKTDNNSTDNDKSSKSATDSESNLSNSNTINSSTDSISFDFDVSDSDLYDAEKLDPNYEVSKEVLQEILTSKKFNFSLQSLISEKREYESESSEGLKNFKASTLVTFENEFVALLNSLTGNENQKTTQDTTPKSESDAESDNKTEDSENSKKPYNSESESPKAKYIKSLITGGIKLGNLRSKLLTCNASSPFRKVLLIQKFDNSKLSHDLLYQTLFPLIFFSFFMMPPFFLRFLKSTRQEINKCQTKLLEMHGLNRFYQITGTMLWYFVESWFYFFLITIVLYNNNWSLSGASTFSEYLSTIIFYLLTLSISIIASLYCTACIGSVVIKSGEGSAYFLLVLAIEIALNVSNVFYGWGISTRIYAKNGIHIIPDDHLSDGQKGYGIKNKEKFYYDIESNPEFGSKLFYKTLIECLVCLLLPYGIPKVMLSNMLEIGVKKTLFRNGYIFSFMFHNSVKLTKNKQGIDSAFPDSEATINSNNYNNTIDLSQDIDLLTGKTMIKQEPSDIKVSHFSSYISLFSDDYIFTLQFLCSVLSIVLYYFLHAYVIEKYGPTPRGSAGVCKSCAKRIVAVKKPMSNGEQFPLKSRGKQYRSEDPEVMRQDQEVGMEMRKIYSSNSSSSGNQFTQSNTNETETYSVLADKLRHRFVVNNADFWALNGISLGIKKGETFGLLGPNGAGKTTTLSLVMGFESEKIGAPTAGKVNYKVKDDASNSKIAIMNVDPYNHIDNPASNASNDKGFADVYASLGVVPQFDILNENLTGRQLVRLFCRMSGTYYKEKSGCNNSSSKTLTLTGSDGTSIKKLQDYGEDRVNRFLDDVGITKTDSDKPYYTYSGGMKRKISLACTLITAPAILFLDESSCGVDIAAQRMLWKKILQKDPEQTVVLTTHSMIEADALCERIGIMVNGELRCLGSSMAIKERYGDGHQLEIMIGLKEPGNDTTFVTGNHNGTNTNTVPNQNVNLMYPQVLGNLVEKVVQSLCSSEYCNHSNEYTLNISDSDNSNTRFYSSKFQLLESLAFSSTRAKFVFTVTDKSDLPKVFQWCLNDPMQVVADFQLGEPTLEQVFLRFARMQEESKLQNQQ